MKFLRFQNDTIFAGYVVEQQKVQLLELLYEAIVTSVTSFWNLVDVSVIEALYRSTKPTSRRLIKSFSDSEQRAKDQEVTTWLRKSI